MSPSTWQQTNLFNGRRALLSRDERGWSVVVDGQIVAAPSLDEAVGQAARQRPAERRDSGRTARVGAA